MEISRREMIAMGLLGSAALVMPMERKVKAQIGSEPIRDRDLPPPFQVPFTTPPVLKPVRTDATTDYYQMTMRNRRVEILPGIKTEIWGYNGITPGPTIMERRGRRTVARCINQIRSPEHEHTSVHLHGNASLPQYDGYASDITLPGQYKDYVWPNEQSARTLWYHDHGVHVTARNAYMGCAAFYITDDDNAPRLPIPQGRYDIPLMLRDALFGRDGSLLFDEDDAEDDLFGNVILVNGKPWPVMKVERRKYRFRVLNASASRGFNLALSSGEPLTVISQDSGLAPRPVEVDSMRVGPAERYGLVIDFAKYRVGQRVVLRNLELKNNEEFENTDVIMAFEIAGPATDRTNNRIPEELDPENEVMQLRASQSVRSREFRFQRHNGHWTINQQTWDDVIRSGFRDTLANPGLGDVEIWRLYNNSGGWNHPVHIHLVDFKILDRNGRPPLPHERGPKDTAYVGEGESVRVIARFGPREGKYMIHCHNLAHEDHDMMHQFQVGQGGPDPINSAPAKPLPAPPL